MHTNKKQNSEKTTNHNSKSRGERLDVGGWKISTSIQEENQSLESRGKILDRKIEKIKLK